MYEELLNSVVGATDESNKKKVICQCAATVYSAVKDVNQSIDIANQIVDRVYASV